MQLLCYPTHARPHARPHAHTQQERRSPVRAAAALLHPAAHAQQLLRAAPLFALCLNCRRALKILSPPRQCRAGRSEPRPGAGPRMTSRGLWPLLRKYENGKKGEEKKDGLRYLTRERLVGGGEGRRRSAG